MHSYIEKNFYDTLGDCYRYSDNDSFSRMVYLLHMSYGLIQTRAEAEKVIAKVNKDVNKRLNANACVRLALHAIENHCRAVIKESKKSLFTRLKEAIRGTK